MKTVRLDQAEMRQGNIDCPECGQRLALKPGSDMPWCRRHAHWLCSAECMTAHLRAQT